MMFGWDNEDADAARRAREKPDPKPMLILAICLAPPLAGLVFMVVRALASH